MSEKGNPKKKMGGENNKRGLREDWRLFWRAAKIWNDLLPGYWAKELICLLVGTFSPYFGLFMSAQFVNELAGECSPYRLMELAAVTVLGGFAISVGTRLLEGKNNLMHKHIWMQQSEYIFQVQNRLEYRHAEDPDVVLLQNQILADMNAVG